MQITYPVNEVFESIQGEASFTGTPSVFIRLQGCPVGCHWCDTKHTWEVEYENIIPIAQMIHKTNDAPTFSDMTTAEIMDLLKTYQARHIVITGGEPCKYDLTSLTGALINADYSIQIETSGTFPIRCHPASFITLSPKIDMAGGLEVLRENLNICDEIKYPIGKESDIIKMRSIIYKSLCDNIWLQPLSQNKNATAICVEQATQNNWKVSIQTHKFIGVR